MSYHVFLPQDVFLSKIPNVPLKKYPAPFTRIRCILDPAPCARVRACTREGEEDRRGLLDANSSKCQIPAGTEGEDRVRAMVP